MQAIIFDLDGTLLDAREGFFWQFQELTRLLDGAPVSRGMISAAAAHGVNDQTIRSLVRNTKVPFDEILRQHSAIRQEAHRRYLKLYDGVDELLPILNRMGIKLAAYSTDDHTAAASLQRLGIHHYFDAVVTTSEVTNPKPHPEGVHLILNKLGADASETIIVGDTVVDILAGRNAGLKKAVGISHGSGHIEALHAAGADHVVHNIPSILDVIE